MVEKTTLQDPTAEEGGELVHWYSDQQYVNAANGQTVIKRFYSPKHPDPKHRYWGLASIMVNNGQSQQNLPFEFVIKANSVQEAFMRFDAHARPAGEERVRELQQQAQAAQSKIVVPSAGFKPS